MEKRPGKHSKLEQEYKAMIARQEDRVSSRANAAGELEGLRREIGDLRQEVKRLRLELKRREDNQQEVERLRLEIAQLRRSLKDRVASRQKKDIAELISVGGQAFVRLWYIYGLVDPRDRLIHYVGVTDKPETRYWNHLNSQEKAASKNAWIADLRREGLQPDLIILETIISGRGDDRYLVEAQWIDACLKAGMPLKNREGASGR